MALVITTTVMGAVILLFFGIFRLIGPDQDVEERLLDGRGRPAQQSGRSERSTLQNRVNSQFSQGRFGAQLTIELAQAGVQITAVEFIALNVGLVIASILFGLLMTQTFYAGLGLAVIAALGPRFWLKRRKEKRIVAFQQQLPDVLNMIVGSLRAGYGLLQSLKLVAQEMPSPSQEEYGRVANEVSLGFSLQQALAHLVERMESEDLLMVVTAINIQNEVGGNLGNILDTIAETIRERVRVEGEIRSMTSMQRMTGYMLAAMPFFVGVILMFLNPNYIMQMFVFPWYFIPIGAIISMGLGIMIMNKLVDIDF